MSKKPKRRTFIPALQDRIVQECPGTREATLAAVALWSDGGRPRHPYDAGVFAVCDALAQRLDEMP